MEEQKDVVQNNASQTASVEARDTSNSTETAPDQGTEQVQPATESSTPGQSKDNNFNNSENGKKPTRYERRIDKLIGKLREKDAPKQQESSPDFNSIFGMQPNQPLIRPEEAENGIDPNEFNRRLETQRLVDREIIKKEIQADQQFKDVVKDHLADAEKTAELLKDDEMLNEIVAEQYDMANYTINPITGNRDFTPRVKLSDIYAKQKKLLDAKIAKATADISGKLANTSQTGALSPSLQGNSTKSEELSSSFETAKESGELELWAEHLKKLGIS